MFRPVGPYTPQLSTDACRRCFLPRAQVAKPRAHLCTGSKKSAVEAAEGRMVPQLQRREEAQQSLPAQRPAREANHWNALRAMRPPQPSRAQSHYPTHATAHPKAIRTLPACDLQILRVSDVNMHRCVLLSLRRWVRFTKPTREEDSHAILEKTYKQGHTLKPKACQKLKL